MFNISPLAAFALGAFTVMALDIVITAVRPNTPPHTTITPKPSAGGDLYSYEPDPTVPKLKKRRAQPELPDWFYELNR